MAVENPEERNSQISVPKGAQRSDDGVLDFNTNVGLFRTVAITPTSPRPVMAEAPQTNTISLWNWSRNSSFCLWQKAAFSVSLTWNQGFYWDILKVPHPVYLLRLHPSFKNDGCSRFYQGVASTSLAVQQTLFGFPDKISAHIGKCGIYNPTYSFPQGKNVLILHSTQCWWGGGRFLSLWTT